MMHLYIALLCIVVHPMRFTIMWGGGGGGLSSIYILPLYIACIKNKALQLKDQVQLMKLLIIRKDVARPSAQLAVVLLLNIQWVLLNVWCS